MVRALVTCISICLLAGCGPKRVGFASLRVADAEGRLETPLAADGGIRVFLFILQDCPVANWYAPQINELMHEYAARGVKFYIVYVDDQLTAEQARKHMADHGYACTALLDPGHDLTTVIGATVTPEAAVVAANGELAYLGRIDDRVLDYGKKRLTPDHRDLREAIDAVLAGQPVPHPRTKAVGCFIPEARTK